MSDDKIYKALGKVMSEVGAVSKDKVNQTQNFKFRGIDDLMNALHNAFAKHGIVVVPNELEHIQDVYEKEKSFQGRVEKSVQFRSRVHMQFTFTSTEDGSSITADGWGEAMDNGDKGYNKCKSIALKYVLMQMFLVPTEDIADPDADDDKKAPAKTATAPQSKAAPKAEQKSTAKAEQKAEAQDDELDKAIAECASKNTLAELTAHQKAYPRIAQHPAFREALTKRYNEINTK